MEILLLVLIIVAAISILGALASGAVHLLISLAIAAFIGWLAGKLVRGESFGLLGDIILGIVGGWVGNLLLGALRLGWVGDIWLVGAIVAGVVGAVVVVAVIHLLFPDGAGNIGKSKRG